MDGIAVAERVSRAARWALAAMLVFQVSASVGAHLTPVETFTAVSRAHVATGR